MRCVWADMFEVNDERTVTLSQVAFEENSKFFYEYDFGHATHTPTDKIGVWISGFFMLTFKCQITNDICYNSKIKNMNEVCIFDISSYT